MTMLYVIGWLLIGGIVVFVSIQTNRMTRP
jgi:hypothetical protein